jgi:hypothetical protein
MHKPAIHQSFKTSHPKEMGGNHTLAALPYLTCKLFAEYLKAPY